MDLKHFRQIYLPQQKQNSLKTQKNQLHLKLPDTGQFFLCRAHKTFDFPNIVNSAFVQATLAADVQAPSTVARSSSPEMFGLPSFCVKVENMSISLDTSEACGQKKQQGFILCSWVLVACLLKTRKVRIACFLRSFCFSHLLSLVTTKQHSGSCPCHSDGFWDFLVFQSDSHNVWQQDDTL